MANPVFRPWVLVGTTVLIFAVLMAWLWWPAAQMRSREPLVLYCAAGMKAPVEATVREYTKRTGVPVQVQYGGSQTLLAGLEISHRGDLYLPADDSYVDIGRRKNLLAETILLARMQLVLAVKKGNPKSIHDVQDLLRPEVRVAQGDPDATAVGHVTREALRATGQWEAVQRRASVVKLTVNDISNDIKIGAVDVGFCWDAVVQQYPDLEMIRVPRLTNATAKISICVLSTCTQPSIALHFARFLGAPEYGLKEFTCNHYEAVPGDTWAEKPELVLYSGAVNRVAVENSIQEFERREGVRVNCVYNGCGILVGQMKAGGRPDAYLTCDASFVPPVADLFQAPPIAMSKTEIIILVSKGNPHNIDKLADLAKSGLRVGVANAEQSTLGALTKRLLDQAGIYEQVMRNVVTQTPTADLLVNQMRAGTLDAVVVYTANTTKVRDTFDLIKLSVPEATAIQTFSIGQNSKYKHLARRLLETLQSAESQARYQECGFQAPPSVANGK